VFLLGLVLGFALILFGMVNREEESPTFVPARSATATAADTNP